MVDAATNNSNRVIQLCIKFLSKIGLEVKNIGGGRGFSEGVLVFCCPVCGDRLVRGWLNSNRLTAGCFRASCQVSGGRSLTSYISTLIKLGICSKEDTEEIRAELLSAPITEPTWKTKPAKKQCWVRYPDFAEVPIAAMDLPWQLNPDDLLSFGLLGIKRGAQVGILIPVTLNLLPCYYVIRYDNGKYYSARAGIDCSHAKSECLFGIDFVGKNSVVVITESAQDAIAVMTRYNYPALALLGSTMSEAQMALIYQKKPTAIVVALDADAVSKSVAIAKRLMRFPVDCPVVVARWIGAKDASRGGVLDVEPSWILNRAIFEEISPACGDYWQRALASGDQYPP